MVERISRCNRIYPNDHLTLGIRAIRAITSQHDNPQGHSFIASYVHQADADPVDPPSLPSSTLSRAGGSSMTSTQNGRLETRASPKTDNIDVDQ